MLRIDRKERTFKRLTPRAMPEAGIRERDDLQRMIKASPGEFFEEMGENLLLVGEEVKPTDIVDDRIDLLAIDPEGTAAIIELKRQDHKLHLLQALAYASMVSKWDPSRFVAERAQMLSKAIPDVEEEI